MDPAHCNLMDAPEHRNRNRRLGIILCLLFVGLFAIVTASMITGSKTPPPVEDAIKDLIVPVLAIIGVLLIIAAVFEVVRRIVKNRHMNNDTE